MSRTDLTWEPQFFKNCSSVGLFLRVQSFGNRLLQHGSPMGHSFCQEHAPAWALHGLHLPLGHILHLLWCAVLCGLYVVFVATLPWSSMGCWGQPALPWSSPLAIGECALVPEAPPFPPSQTSVSTELFLSYFSHSPLSCHAVLLFLVCCCCF